MRSGEFRPLTTGEGVLAHEVFGTRLSPDRVRLLAVPFWPRAFVASARLIVWPVRTARRDFSTAPIAQQAVFLHELTHVWQAQHGVNLIVAKLRAGDHPAAYAYDLDRQSDFSQMNVEQQAMVVQHSFLARRGEPAPYQANVYAALLLASGDKGLPVKTEV